MIKKLFAAAALTLMAASSAHAAPGFYMGADVGSTKYDGYRDSEDSIGIFGGYDFNDNFAIEAGYRDLYAGLSFDATQVAVSGVGTIRLKHGFKLYGRLGLNHLSSESKNGGRYGFESATKIMYGFGAGYNFTPAFSARVEVQKPAANLTNVSVGVAYKF